MRGRRARLVVLVLVAISVAAGLVALGRASAGAATARSDGYQEGRIGGYADGMHDGRAAGLQEGRALQVPLTLPSGRQDAATAAFNAGYAAGANDVFGGYDGGWDMDSPYIVVLTQAGNGITYRIRSRTPMQRGVNYRLCPHSTVLCQEPG
jgi:hypothetical protein